MKEIQYQPIIPPIVVPQPSLVYNQFTVNLLSGILGVSATFGVQLYNGDIFMGSKIMIMGGDDYLAWGNDDNYVYSWVNSQLQIIYP